MKKLFNKAKVPEN